MILIKNLKRKMIRTGFEQWLQKKHEQYQTIYFELLLLPDGYNVAIKKYENEQEYQSWLAADHETWYAIVLKRAVEEKLEEINNE